jgi:hypothetical protein
MLTTRSLRLLATPAVLVGAAVMIAACGGSSPTSGSGTSSAGSNQSFSSAAADAYRFSACMRRHGVPNFPDPKVSESPGHQQIAIKVSPASNGPAFASAQKDCAGIMPAAQNGPSQAQQEAHVQGELAFVRCLRAHGFPNFPDPTAQGQLTPKMLTDAGINLHQPAVLQAGDACVSSSHGVITKAAVAQAVNGTNQPGSDAQSSSAAPSGG